MALTIQQVQENNVVAKGWMNEIVPEIKKLRLAQQVRKQLPFMKRVAMAELFMAEDAILKVLEEALMQLKLYFKYHYSQAALLSKFDSPVLSFTAEKDRLFYKIKTTYFVGEVPHPVKF
jgi:hypothetical protein